MIKGGAGHHPHSLRDPGPIADFLSQQVQPAGVDPPPYLGGRISRSSFYGPESPYRLFPEEGIYITCRGPWFTPSFDRYSFDLKGVEGSINVIVPKTAAPGKPWVFRADFVGRDAAVDLALLERGFHIVTGPVPYNADGPSLKSWNAVYDLFTGHGSSKKPVLEGAGGAAGEAYAWAIANPDRVHRSFGGDKSSRGGGRSPPLIVDSPQFRLDDGRYPHPTTAHRQDVGPDVLQEPLVPLAQRRRHTTVAVGTVQLA